jgi:putative endonuclease
MNPALPEHGTLLQKPDTDWYYVYVLNSLRNSDLYIGCASNLEKRVNEHNRGKVYSTKNMLPVELIYYEAYRLKEQAYKREKSLKAFGSGLSKIKIRLGIHKKGRAG